MNQAQIRAVKDVLDGKFKRAKTVLEGQAQSVGDLAVADAQARATKNTAIVRQLQDAICGVNEAIANARSMGLDFVVQRFEHAYDDDVEQYNPASVRVRLSSDTQRNVREKAVVRIDHKIAALDDLRSMTYLRLHNVPGQDLADLVNEVVTKITELL